MVFNNTIVTSGTLLAAASKLKDCNKKLRIKGPFLNRCFKKQIEFVQMEFCWFCSTIVQNLVDGKDMLWVIISYNKRHLWWCC